MTTTQSLVLDAETIGQVDAAGIEALGQLGDKLRDDGDSVVVRERAPSSRACLRQRKGFTSRSERKRFYPTVHASVRELR